ncbi:hypothetical protein JXA85_03525 [Candidatus Woesearchaeota archaeon]|nr:hypothetical protein [Candidatus Woesearchaeota archaeon]
MNSFPWILAVIVLLLILGTVALIIALKKKKKTPSDYYTFFIMGIIWMATGAIVRIFGNDELDFFFILGLAYALIGIMHKKDWKKNRSELEKTGKSERKLATAITVMVGLFVLLGLIMLVLFQK